MGDSRQSGFGRYTLVERIAIGGMAELFLATAPGEHGFARKVVIKRLLPHLSSEPLYTAMFIDEAKLTARLAHPKIAQTYELGKAEGELFIAMEFVDGIDVLAMLREMAWLRRRIETEHAVWICHEVLDALDFAHNLKDDKGNSLAIVHRDISPSNVLLSRRGDVKLVDFGIARASGPDRHHHTKTGTLKGKYGYMSPEQIMEQPVDARSDLFSVGILLAEMLCGRRLFAAPAEIDVLLMVRDAKLGRLDQFGGHIPASLNALVRKSLRKDPSERWSSAAEMREALAQWLFDERKRVGPPQIAALVESLHEVAWRRRRESMSQGAGDQAVLNLIGAQSGDVNPVAGDIDVASPDDGEDDLELSIAESVAQINPLRAAPPVPRRGLAATIDPGSSSEGLEIDVSSLGELVLPALPTSEPSGTTHRRRGRVPVATVPNPAPALETDPGAGSRDIDFSVVSRDIDIGAVSRDIDIGAVSRDLELGAVSRDIDIGTASRDLELDTPSRDLELEIPSRDLELDNPSRGLRFSAPPIIGANPSAPEVLSDELDAGVPQFIADSPSTARVVDPEEQIGSIAQAISSLAPVAPDQSSFEFDDVAVEGTNARSRPVRIPTPAEVVEAAGQREPPKLAEIAAPPTSTGDFAHLSPISLLFQLISARSTGLLTAAVGGIRKEVYLRDGVAEYVTSNMASELLGHYLVANGALSSGELAMALAMMPHYGGKLGDTLVGLGLLKPLEVFRHLTFQIRQKLIDVCTWTKGTFAWYEGKENQRAAFPLDLNPFEVLGAGAMALHDDAVRQWVDQHAARPVTRSRERSAEEVERFEIPGLVSLYGRISSKPTIGKLIKESRDANTQRRTTRMLLLLQQCDFLRTGP